MHVCTQRTDLRHAYTASHVQKGAMLTGLATIVIAKGLDSGGRNVAREKREKRRKKKEGAHTEVGHLRVLPPCLALLHLESKRRAVHIRSTRSRHTHGQALECIEGQSRCARAKVRRWTRPTVATLSPPCVPREAVRATCTSRCGKHQTRGSSRT